MYTAKDYSKLIGMEGLSEALLKNHFTLYQGYVTNTNKLLEAFPQFKDDKMASPEFGELRRRFGWEFNGMRLHEYYFENLGGKGVVDKNGRLAKKLAEDFGSYDAWEKEFRAVGVLQDIGRIFGRPDLDRSAHACCCTSHRALVHGHSPGAAVPACR